MATSSIRIKKICQWCGAEFEAQKVSTKYCSHRCANLAYKQATREKRVKQVEAETHFIKSEKPKENVKDKGIPFNSTSIRLIRPIVTSGL